MSTKEMLRSSRSGRQHIGDREQLEELPDSCAVIYRTLTEEQRPLRPGQLAERVDDCSLNMVRSAANRLADETPLVEKRRDLRDTRRVVYELQRESD